MHATRSAKRAFSLVELSIVLVILGLLVGGVLTGQSLIRAAELRSVTTEYQRYVTATHTFRDKYFMLPGDMNNATQFWGVAAGAGNDSTCFNTVQTTAATCNGNGDGVIAPDPSNYATKLFWKHLANAGLIEGNFSGTAATNGGFSALTTNMPDVRPGWNMPSSKVGAGFWGTANYGGWNAAIQKFFGPYGATAAPYYPNSISLLPSTGIEPWAGGPLSTDEAWNLDTKIDDGKPGSGKVEAFTGGSGVASGGPCVTGTTPPSATYKLDQSGKLCSLTFVGAFR